MSSRPASAHGADDVDRSIAIERRDLHRDDVRDLGERAPERVVERDAADRRLQVEPERAG